MRNILSPSILSADFWEMGEQIRTLEKAGVEWLHIDVMDGIFVPSISYGMPVIASLRGRTKLFFDVHLMIDRPERYIAAFAESGADLINFHLEATDDAEQAIALIRQQDRKVGITIKPGTPAQAVEPFLKLVDMVLVMTVEPGFGGQKLIPECLEKVREVRRMADRVKPGLHIEVDGGINVQNVETAIEAGADIIVAGSAVFRKDITANVADFLGKL